MRFVIETLGCKVNQYESAAIAELLRGMGHTESDRDCGAVIVNTCAVTGEAARKSRQAARRLMSRHPDALLAICGCSGGVEPEWAAELGAALVSGSGDRRGFVQRLDALMRGLPQYPEPESGGFEILPPSVSPGRTRAALKIQDGCDNYCAYCIIPFSRGAARSMPLASVAEQAAELMAHDYREIVVTGIEISSYGRGLSGGETLLDAVRAVSHSAPGARIRLSSLEPSSVTRDFALGLAALPNICPHFHLSLQSGCDATLARMNRKYDTAQFLAAVTMLRGLFPNCGVTADIITGFPGETDAEFESTLRFAETCAFSGAHIFPFSVRPGTAASNMPGKIPAAVKRERARQLRGITARSKAAFLKAQVGLAAHVLFETEQDGVCSGHTGNYCVVNMQGSGLHGEIRRVLVTGSTGEHLIASPAAP